MSQTRDDSWSIKEVLSWSTNYLKEKGSSSARLDAELLMADSLGLKRIQLYTYFDRPLEPEERGKIREVLKRRAAGEPVAYILGCKDFMGHSFSVNSDVLIPRSDTEVLVEKVLEEIDKDSAPSILDIGTGSGCIILSLASRLPSAKFTAWDKSKEALALAKNNALDLEIDNVDFLERDALDPGSWEGEHFDIILSNPPYITDAEMLKLAPTVQDFEPEMALSGGEDGLVFYRFFASKLTETLNPDGRVYWEIGFEQGASVSQMLKDAGLVDVRVIQDYAGLDRVVTGCMPKLG